ncbi:hypothetical protein V1506DRAFT_509403 [Lipomyces tetrasporus]
MPDPFDPNAPMMDGGLPPQAQNASKPLVSRPPKRSITSTDAQNGMDRLAFTLTERPYGPLVRDGVTWFARIKRVVLGTYRIPDEDVQPETLLQPSRSFTIVEEGEFVGGGVPPNLQEVVLGDCIPDHILSGEAIVATPVNFSVGNGSKPSSKTEW